MALGPNFADEVRAAGLAGLPFAWGADGQLQGLENLTRTQRTRLSQLVAAHVPGASRQQVREEAERRIAAGTTIAGQPFRTDDTTMGRLRELLALFDAGDASAEKPVSYMTTAGNVLLFESKADVEAVYRPAMRYRSAVLQASRALQETAPIPLTFADDEHWPAAAANGAARGGAW